MSKRILIVDDSDTVRKVIRLFLETHTGLEVCGEAGDGVDGIEKAKQLRPDLVLLDLAMPRMNGAEAASVMKGQRPDVPIVLFTIHGEMMGRSMTSAVGVNAVLSKSDGLGKLAECIQGLLA
jgi:DNA-binding NarL/FixJ family response regulator